MRRLLSLLIFGRKLRQSVRQNFDVIPFDPASDTLLLVARDYGITDEMALFVQGMLGQYGWKAVVIPPFDVAVLQHPVTVSLHLDGRELARAHG